MTTWEYKVEKLVLECAGPAIGIAKPTDLAALVAVRLNDLGKEGWELVDVTGPLPQSCNPPVLALLYFKRPK